MGGTGARPAWGLNPGDKLGPYEIVGSLGAGGMGEVYRARDPRLGRDVAIKVLPGTDATSEQILRLEREARAVGSLNHPNILAIFDVGNEDGRPFVVSELLEGETLRERLSRGPVPVRRALEFAAQIAEGLAAAHAKGICHRDLKPDNVFLTADARVKILDFGLAKLLHAASSPEAKTSPNAYPLSELSTESGVVLGTAAYMSPEQVRGQDSDHRADIFALGVVLYEMVAGRHAFRQNESVDTLHAILHDEAPELPQESGVSVGVAHLVRRCLEKRPEERFQSARDLAFQLKELQGGWATTSPTGVASRPGRRRWMRIAAGLVVAAALVVATSLVGPMLLGGRAPHFRQLSFRRGVVTGARFAPDSRAVVYSAAWGSEGAGVWMTFSASHESRSLGYPGAHVLGVSSGGELALSLRRRYSAGERYVGTLARVPLSGGAPRELLEGVEAADWGPDGELAVLRSGGVGTAAWIDYPPGQTLYRTKGAILGLRVSPDAQRIAFLEDASTVGAGGVVTVVDRKGKVDALTAAWSKASGVSWGPGGKEVWFTAGDDKGPQALRAVTLSGKQRLVAQVPGSLVLQDVARDGRVLLVHEDERYGLRAVPPGETAERELSWLDNSGLADLSRDGRTILFGDRFGVYLRTVDGGEAVHLGAGYADEISPDGKRVLTTTPNNDALIVLPAGAGQARPLARGHVVSYAGAHWFPNGSRIVFNGREASAGLRAYVQDVDAGDAPRAVTPEGQWALAATPDGSALLSVLPDHSLGLFDLTTGQSRPMTGTLPGDRPAGWSTDGSRLWVFQRAEIPVTVNVVDLQTGRRTPWRSVIPPDPEGVFTVTKFRTTPDGSGYAYSYRRLLSTLYMLEGVP